MGIDSDRPAGIPRTRRFDRMTFYYRAHATGSAGKNQLKKYARGLKRDNQIEFYRIREDTAVTARGRGRSRQTRWVLYVTYPD